MAYPATPASPNGTSTTRIIRRSPSIVAGTSRELGTPDSRADAAAAMGVTPSIGDRKSTRLNQSLMRISYAVFCLKKKNTLNNTTPTKSHTLSTLTDSNGTQIATHEKSDDIKQ